MPKSGDRSSGCVHRDMDNEVIGGESANEQRLNGQCIKTNVISIHSYEWDFGDWDVSYVPSPAKATRVATPHGRDAFTPMTYTEISHCHLLPR